MNEKIEENQKKKCKRTKQKSCHHYKKSTVDLNLPPSQDKKLTSSCKCDLEGQKTIQLKSENWNSWKCLLLVWVILAFGGWAIVYTICKLLHLL